MCVGDTGSNLTSSVSFTETFARAVPKTYLPGSPGIEMIRAGQRTAVCGTDGLKTPPFKGGKGVVRITLGWIIDRSSTPNSSIPGRYNIHTNSQRFRGSLWSIHQCSGVRSLVKLFPSGFFRYLSRRRRHGENPNKAG